MYIPPIASAIALAIGVFTHILREASASLLVRRRWAMREPLTAGRATGMALTLSYIQTSLDESHK